MYLCYKFIAGFVLIKFLQVIGINIFLKIIHSKYKRYWYIKLHLYEAFFYKMVVWQTFIFQRVSIDVFYYKKRI